MLQQVARYKFIRFYLFFMKKRYVVGLSFSLETISAIDAAKGMIPRSRFIEKIVNDYLEAQEWSS